MLTPTDRFVPHNRVRGAEIDRGQSTAHLLEHTFIGLRSEIRPRARVGALVAAVSLR